MNNTRKIIGCWYHERWRTELTLHPFWSHLLGMQWITLRNRNEHIELTKESSCICQWQDSSLLTVARVFPRVGGRLLKRCLDDWPVMLNSKCNVNNTFSVPLISIILPVGGQDRINAFKAVLAGFFGQTLKNIQLIVVEHGLNPEYQSFCPDGVKYVFLPRETTDQFNKSKVMNCGVDYADAPYVLLHDADVIPPARYAERIMELFTMGWEAVRPLRFTFLLDQAGSEIFIKSGGKRLPEEVSLVQQNNPGLSTALSKEAYIDIGGHDESFQVSGGEDLEFLDRLKTRRLFPGGFVPCIHLWHPPVESNTREKNNTLAVEIRRAPAEERIRILKECRDNWS